MRVVTNNVPRQLWHGYELPEGIWQKDFEYITKDDMYDESFHRFFKYRGEWYDVKEFMATELPGWHGIQTDTFFSATVITYRDNFESVIVGRVYS